MTRKEANEVFSQYRPKIGQPITYRGKLVGLVRSVEGNLCWVNYFNEPSNPFIWCFHDGLNNMHDWPGKDKSLECKTAGVQS